MMGVILFMIYINKDQIEGKFSVTIDLLTNDDGMEYEEITGVIETPEELDKKFLVLAGGIILLKGIEITSKSFGSEDNNIAYTFRAREYRIIRN